MWRLLEAVAAKHLVRELRLTVDYASDRLQRLVSGLVFAQIGLLLVALGLVFGLGGLFFHLGDLGDYVTPALLTGLSALLPGLVSFWIAARLFRR